MKNTRHALVIFVTALMTTSCGYAHDGVDMAYRSYVDTRSRCESIPDPGRRDACMQVAIQQMAGQIDNYMTQTAKPQMPNQWQQTQPGTTQEVTLEPPPAYTPSLPEGVIPAPQEPAPAPNSAEDGDTDAEPDEELDSSLME
jgi:hypothetical protein